jgi:FixJ family two-component response regulator
MGEKNMLGLLVADKDVETRKQMADLLIEAGYDVTVTNSAAKAIHGVLKKTAHVLLLGTELDEFTSAELVPLLKKCNRNLMIILVADDTPLPLMRKVRKAGIFYHALRPIEPEGKEEIRQVVKCAIASLSKTPIEKIAH